MPDQRSVMKEFRALDGKRLAGGLTPAEEERYALLLDLIGPEDAGSLSPGFDVDAAAAELRDSLLPAALRNRPPAAPAQGEPQAEEPPAQPDALDLSSFSPEAGQPQYDSASAENTEDDPGQPAWDPNAPYDPAAAAPYDPSAAYDPGAPFDPNAPAGWDPSVPYDPDAQDAAAQGWDPAAQPYDPNAQADAGPLDPNAQPWDAAQAQEPGSQAAWDGAAYDAEPPADPGALPYDPNASPEAGAQGYPAPEATGAGLDLLAEPGAAPPEGWIAESGPDAVPGGQGDAVPGGAGAELESLLPFDPSAEAAIAPGEVPDGFDRPGGEYDDAAVFQDRYPDAAPADLPGEEPGFEAAKAVEPEAVEGWQPEPAVDAGFELASGGSFDAAADAAAPEWAGGDTAVPWEGAASAQDAGSSAFAEPGEEPVPVDALEHPMAAEPAAGVSGPEDLEPLDAGAVPGAGADLGALDDFAVDVEVPADLPLPGEEPQLDFSRPDFSEGAPPEEDAAFADSAAGPTAAAAAAEASFDVAPGAGAGVSPMDLGPPPELDIEAAPAAAEAPPLEVEDDVPTIEGEEILEEIAVDEPPSATAEPRMSAPAGPPLAEELPPPVSEPAPPVIAPPPPAPVALPPPRATAPPPAEAPPPRPAAFAPPPPPPAIAQDAPPAPEPEPPPAEAGPSCHVPGVHRVVVHTVEGQVKRGVLEDVDLDAGTLGLAPQPGADPEVLPSEKVKAIFFMLSPGEKAPPAEGKKVRVTFRDGRQVAGFSPDYRESGVGFFMVPGDTRTSTGRIWVYRAAVRQVSVS